MPKHPEVIFKNKTIHDKIERIAANVYNKAFEKSPYAKGYQAIKEWSKSTKEGK